jgi:hypothetical protein
MKVINDAAIEILKSCTTYLNQYPFEHIVIDDLITIKIKNVIIQYNDEKYSITLTAYIDNIVNGQYEPIELYYYWTLDSNLDILETTYFRYHIKKTKLNWYIIDETLSNIMIAPKPKSGFAAIATMCWAANAPLLKKPMCWLGCSASNHETHLPRETHSRQPVTHTSPNAIATVTASATTTTPGRQHENPWTPVGLDRGFDGDFGRHGPRR